MFLDSLVLLEGMDCLEFVVFPVCLVLKAILVMMVLRERQGHLVQKDIRVLREISDHLEDLGQEDKGVKSAPLDRQGKKGHLVWKAKEDQREKMDLLG